MKSELPNLTKRTDSQINKCKFIGYIGIIVLLTAITPSLLYNNPVVEPQKQKTPDYYNRNTENQNNNVNEALHAPNTSPNAGVYTLLTLWDGLDIITTPATATPFSTPSPPVFNVTTTNYECTTGDSSSAIQNAIDSLPENRTEPINITLQGVFNSVQNVLLEDNINFVGQNAVLIAVNNTNMFTLNPNKNAFSEIHKVFNIDGYDRQFVDWINLHNVTFQSIHFKQPVEISSSRYAINFFEKNSTGWGISDNLSIYDCEFEGFINCVQGLAFESSYVNNYFHNYSNNGLLLLYGLNITIQQNVFESSPSPISINQYTSMYGPGSMIGRIGLFLLDVCENVLVSDNMFIQGTNSTGLAFSSSIGNYLVTNNIFIGEGVPCVVDFNERPFLSAGIQFSDNTGAEDFTYNNGVYS